MTMPTAMRYARNFLDNANLAALAVCGDHLLFASQHHQDYMPLPLWAMPSHDNDNDEAPYDHSA